MVTEKKKVGRPKKVKPSVDKVSTKEFEEAVHEKLLKDTAKLQEKHTINQYNQYRVDYLAERNRYLQKEVAKADNIATELSLVRNQLEILHSRSEKILHLMNKPVEPTQVTKIHETSNDVDEDGYNVDTDWRSYLLEQDERVDNIVAWNWVLFTIAFGLLIYLLIKPF